MAADYPGIDAGFAYATWAFETGHGSSLVWLTNNNPAGIIKTDGSGEYETYASQEDGIRAMFELLKHYCDRGNDSVARIRNVWSESEDIEIIIQMWKEIVLEEN